MFFVFSLSDASVAAGECYSPMPPLPCHEQQLTSVEIVRMKPLPQDSQQQNQHQQQQQQHKGSRREEAGEEITNPLQLMVRM